MKEQHLLKSALLLIDYLKEKGVEPSIIDAHLNEAPFGLFKALDQFNGRSFGTLLFAKLRLSDYLQTLKDTTSAESLCLKPLEAIITGLYVEPRENPKQGIFELIAHLNRWLTLKPESYQDRDEARKLCLVFYLLLKLLTATVSNLSALNRTLASRFIPLQNVANDAFKLLKAVNEQWQQLAPQGDQKSPVPEEALLQQQSCWLVAFRQRYQSIAHQKKTHQGKLAQLHGVISEDCTTLQTLERLQLEKQRMKAVMVQLHALEYALANSKLTLAAILSNYSSAFQMVLDHSSVQVKKELLSPDEARQSPRLLMPGLLLSTANWFFKPVADPRKIKLQQALPLVALSFAQTIKTLDDAIVHQISKIFPDNVGYQGLLLRLGTDGLTELIGYNQQLQALCLLAQRVMQLHSYLNKLHLPPQSQLFITQEMPGKEKQEEAVIQLLNFFTEGADREAMVPLKNNLKALFTRLEIGVELVTKGFCTITACNDSGMLSSP
ncbi:purine NTPase [Legionella rubrilucens]|uniref:Purine NTPase n=2 Tax=Legionella rubrilucens TaxID=458 RepID=A0A0W0XYD4_9GAMM|nr:purine NTPase [Legionella rubrilucens]